MPQVRAASPTADECPLHRMSKRKSLSTKLLREREHLGTRRALLPRTSQFGAVRRNHPEMRLTRKNVMKRRGCENERPSLVDCTGRRRRSEAETIDREVVGGSSAQAVLYVRGDKVPVSTHA